MKSTRIGFYGVILAIPVFLAGGEISHASEEMPPPGVTPSPVFRARWPVDLPPMNLAGTPFPGPR